MALTLDILKANTVLASLTEEQLNSIVTLSSNDESTVLGTKIGELHGSYDKDVKDVTGIEKKQGEKSYDYVKRVLGDYKGKLTTLEATKVDLEKKISDGATDPALKQKLADTEKSLSDMKALYDSDKTKFDTEKQAYEAKIKEVHVEHAFGTALSGVKFKAAIPESVHGTLVNNAKAEILSKYKADFVEANGSKVLVFRDDKGNIVANPQNKLEPFTAKELMLASSLKDVLDFGIEQPGAGTGKSAAGQSSIVDISSAKSQVEADELISTQLLAQGLTRGSAEFAAKQLEVRKENSVDKLPLR